MNEGKDSAQEVKRRGGHKPKKTHPWKNAVSPEVARFAEEKSRVTSYANFKKGGGISQK